MAALALSVSNRKLCIRCLLHYKVPDLVAGLWALVATTGVEHLQHVPDKSWKAETAGLFLPDRLPICQCPRHLHYMNGNKINT